MSKNDHCDSIDFELIFSQIKETDQENNEMALNILDVNVFINGKKNKDNFEFIDFLNASKYDNSEFSLFNCSCGVPGCAGYHTYITTTITNDNIILHLPEEQEELVLYPDAKQKNKYVFNKEELYEKFENIKLKIIQEEKNGYCYIPAGGYYGFEYDCIKEEAYQKLDENEKLLAMPINGGKEKYWYISKPFEKQIEENKKFFQSYYDFEKILYERSRFIEKTDKIVIKYFDKQIETRYPEFIGVILNQFPSFDKEKSTAENIRNFENDILPVIAMIEKSLQKGIIIQELVDKAAESFRTIYIDYPQQVEHLKTNNDFFADMILSSRYLMIEQKEKPEDNPSYDELYHLDTSKLEIFLDKKT